jgi:16S rRNA (cytidine1402-2'-O)-methyltransferase
MSTSSATEPGCLYLVATPIGNLGDISQRALDVLSEATVVAAEDTRHTRKLLAAKGLTAELVSYREQNHRRAAGPLLERLEAGESVALVTDAGTPGISDPGQALVQLALERGLRVVPIPGPCAAICALSASGLSSDRFVFIGFLPRKQGALRRSLEALRSEAGSLVFYESPKRLGKTLTALFAALGERRAVVVREVTKLYETFERGSLSELADRFQQGARGEVTLVVEGCASLTSEATRAMPQAGLEALVAALRSGRSLSASQIAKLLAPLAGVERKQIYQLAAEIPIRKDPGEQEARKQAPEEED